jgi:hypothetical protein
MLGSTICKFKQLCLNQSVDLVKWEEQLFLHSALCSLDEETSVSHKRHLFA